MSGEAQELLVLDEEDERALLWSKLPGGSTLLWHPVGKWTVWPPSRFWTLLHEIDAVGVDVVAWPWSTTDSAGLVEHAQHREQATRFGPDWWIADLEERWQRGQVAAPVVHVVEGPGRTDAGYPSTAQVLNAHAELQQQYPGQHIGYGRIAKWLGSNKWTVKRRLAKIASP